MCSHRLFLAVPIPNEQKREIAKIVENIQGEWPFQKWVHPDDYHITLHFLGDCSRIQMIEIIERLQENKINLQPFTLKWNGFGLFGREEQPKILWIGVKGRLESLRSLHHHVTRVLTPIGYPSESRTYHPHITLARKYKLQNFSTNMWKNQQWDDTSKWKVDRFVLYESHLGQVPMYEEVASFSLL